MNNFETVQNIQSQLDRFDPDNGDRLPRKFEPFYYGRNWENDFPYCERCHEDVEAHYCLEEINGQRVCHFCEYELTEGAA